MYEKLDTGETWAHPGEGCAIAQKQDDFISSAIAAKLDVLKTVC